MKVFICILLLLVTNEVKQQSLVVKFDKKIEVLGIEEQTYKYYLIIAQCLKKDNLITVSPKKFAKWCTIMGWCESNLNTKVEFNGQQGIPQLTKNTRSLLGIPDILDCTIEQQVWYHYRYFLNCPNLRQVKSLEDLHMMNFKPYGIRKSKANGNPLDLDENGWIDKSDLKLFHKKRIKENKIIKQMYYEIQ